MNIVCTSIACVSLAAGEVAFAAPVPSIGFTVGDGRPGPCELRTFTTDEMSCRDDGDAVVWTGSAHGGDGFTVTARRRMDGESAVWKVSWSGWKGDGFIEQVQISALVPRVGAADVLVPHGIGWLMHPAWAKMKAGQSIHGGSIYSCRVQAVLNEAAQSWVFELRGARFEPVSFRTVVGRSTDEVRMTFMYSMPVSRETSVSFELPFDAVLTPFVGGWFQAAEIYRRGVRGTDWYRKCRARDFGRLRDIGMWFWNRRTSDIVVPPVLKFQKDAGVPAALDWYWWHMTSYDTGYPNYWPPREPEDEFRSAVKTLNENGVYCQTYMNGITWDVDDPSWDDGGSEGIRIRRDGTISAYQWNRFTKHRLGDLCGCAPKFHQRMRSQVRMLRGCGFDAQYLDMIGNGGGSCWNTNHPHALGGGDHLVRNIRRYVEAVRADNPGMQFCTEASNETYMDLFESVIELSPSYERTSGEAVEFARDVVPFFTAVYHRAIVQFGSFAMLDGIPAFDPLWPKEEMWKEEKPWERMFPDQFQLELSRCVVWGQQPCVHNFKINNTTEERYADGYRFMIDTARFYHSNREWLFDGEMLDPGRLDCDKEKVEFLLRATYTKDGEYKVASHVQPTVLHSVWRAPDGRVAAMLVNWSRKERHYELKCPAGDASGTLAPRSYRRIDLP